MPLPDLSTAQTVDLNGAVTVKVSTLGNCWGLVLRLTVLGQVVFRTGCYRHNEQSYSTASHSGKRRISPSLIVLTDLEK